MIIVAIAPLDCIAATTYTVTLTADRTFDPPQLTIVKGDSVTFTNGGGSHNVRADDNSFWCSDDCSLHRSPSAQPWSDTIEFDDIRTVGYYCESHGTPATETSAGTGMRGSIVVVADSIFNDGFDGAAITTPIDQ